MAATIPRFLLPRGFPLLQTRPHVLRQLPSARATSQACSYASDASSKPRVLEKPSKFRPPSHGRRLKKQPLRQYGPELTQQQKAEQKTKQYPSMMPPKGTFMYWFLTNTNIHLFITLGTLVCLASFAAWENWKRDTTFKSRLPSRDDVLAHPKASFDQFLIAWKMSMHESSEEANTKRKRGVEDSQKQAAYRKAHGIIDEQGMDPWPGLEQKVASVGASGSDGNLPQPVDTPVRTREAPVQYEKRPVKKWLGIW